MSENVKDTTLQNAAPPAEETAKAVATETVKTATQSAPAEKSADTKGDAAPKAETPQPTDMLHSGKRRMTWVLIFLVLGAGITIATESMGAYNNADHNILAHTGVMAGFSFVGALLLIILAKFIMTPLLQRDENYYAEGGDDDDA